MLLKKGGKGGGRVGCQRRGVVDQKIIIHEIQIALSILKLYVLGNSSVLFYTIQYFCGINSGNLRKTDELTLS